MDQITSVESGHMLLKGWLRFAGAGFDHTVRYNTRGFRSVFRFMRRFRDELLRGGLPLAHSPVPFGEGLDVKFANALAIELDSGESVLKRAFQPPSEMISRNWLLPRHDWIAGDLLALTSRRLLWITDRERGMHSRYGSIASYAPFDAVLSFDLTAGRGGHILQVGLNAGTTWQIPVARDSPWNCQRIAEDFGAAIDIQKTRNETSRSEVRR